MQDFNGTGYRVMEYYNQDNLLLLNQETGSLLVAVDVKCYDRYPCKGKNSEENRETGIKWGKVWGKHTGRNFKSRGYAGGKSWGDD